MTMQRRHFEVIAEALAASRPPITQGVSYAQWRKVVSEFCGRLSATNGQFNKDRFKRACGVED